MPSKSEKEKRKEIMRQLKEKANESFLSALPMDKQSFQDLFDYLDEKSIEGCDNTLRMTVDFLRERQIENIDRVIEWLNDNGAGCDCEVLANIEELFE